MRIKIHFGGPLRDEIGRTKFIDVPNSDSLSISEFRSVIESQDWSSKIIENGHIKSPVMLIIDEELIQFSQNIPIQITEQSSITFQVMFAGG